MQVSPSGFYAARRRAESTHDRDDRRLRVLVRASFDESRRRYGSPRVYRDLVEQGVRISPKRVARLMRGLGVRGVSRRKAVVTTQRSETGRPAPDLVDRPFTVSARDRLGLV